MSSSKSTATLNSSRELRVVGVQQVVEQRARPPAPPSRSSGIGSGSSDTVLTRLSICPSDSVRISRERSARFSASQAKGCVRTLSASSDQVAAVGAVQRAGLDQREVGDQRAHLREVLDAADEVVVGGVVLVHDRRAAAAAVLDQHVHLVAPQRGLALGLGATRDAEERRAARRPWDARKNSAWSSTSSCTLAEVSRTTGPSAAQAAFSSSMSAVDRVAPSPGGSRSRTLRCASRRHLGHVVDRARELLLRAPRWPSCDAPSASPRAARGTRPGPSPCRSCIGAKPKPAGRAHQRDALPRCAARRSTRSPARGARSNSPSISCSRVRYSSVSKAPGMPVRRSSTSRSMSCAEARARFPAGSSSARGLCGRREVEHVAPASSARCPACAGTG